MTEIGNIDKNAVIQYEINTMHARQQTSIPTLTFCGQKILVAFPFAISSGSAYETACALVVTPSKYTFVRPIGDFSPKWESGNCPSGQQKSPDLNKISKAGRPSEL
jgi:hypothetical protein